ncbi:phospholipase A2 inhibitor and Ly6/PLAUR domain-containing protein-like [Pyxicephalus adspersus]
MATYLLIATILTTLPATGYTLSCIECSSKDNKICNGSSVTCPSGNYSCLLTRVMTTVGEMTPTRIYIRQCAPMKLCSKTGSISMPHSTFRTSLTCCDEDDCTPPEPILPKLSSKKNGKKCPACFEPNAMTCKKETIMDCTGSETICITQFTNTTGAVLGTTVSRGCATKQLCKPEHQVWTFDKMVVNVDNVCENSSNRLHENVLILFLSLSLFLKLLS